MKTIDKNIEWIVAIAVMMISTFSVSSGIINIFFPIGKSIILFSHPLLVILLLLYQNKWYGIKLQNRTFFIFFLLYSVYILLYITELRIYPLPLLAATPSSVEYFMYRTILLLGYLLCAKTIYRKFNVNKFIVVSTLGCLLPTLWYVNLVGVDFLQNYGNSDDSTYIGQLTIAYSNAPLLIIAFFNFNKLFRPIILSRFVSIFIIIAVGYILIVSTKRGPIFWSLICFIFCLYYKDKNVFKYAMTLFILTIVLYSYVDVALDWISKIAPYSAERISRTLYEGDLTSRYDETNISGSAYVIGINQFLNSPIWGSYFRLIVSSGIFKGYYPHNIFIEVLITMGVVGFIPFILLLRKAFVNIHHVFKCQFETNQLSCLVLFLMSFLKLQTTGSLLLYNSFWVFFYIMLCLQIFAKTEKPNKIFIQHLIARLYVPPMRKHKGKD